LLAELRRVKGKRGVVRYVSIPHTQRVPRGEEPMGLIGFFTSYRSETNKA